MIMQPPINYRKTTIVHCVNLSVLAGTNGFQGGDAGHGSETEIRFTLDTAGDIRFSASADGKELAISAEGDSELYVLKEGLAFAARSLADLCKEPSADGQQMLVYRVGEDAPPLPSRIWATFYYVVGKLGVDPLFLSKHIEALEDSKGDLFVRWIGRVPDAWERAFAEAWEVCGNESATNVHHMVLHTSGSPDQENPFEPLNGGLVSHP